MAQSGILRKPLCWLWLRGRLQNTTTGKLKVTIKDKIAKIVDECSHTTPITPFDKMIEQVAEEVGITTRLAIELVTRLLNGDLGTVEKIKKKGNHGKN